MSIVYDFKAIGEALRPERPAKPVSSAGRPICRECYSDLGNPSAPTVVTCRRCGKANYVE